MDVFHEHRCFVDEHATASARPREHTVDGFASGAAATTTPSAAQMNGDDNDEELRHFTKYKEQDHDREAGYESWLRARTRKERLASTYCEWSHS